MNRSPAQGKSHTRSTSLPIAAAVLAFAFGGLATSCGGGSSGGGGSGGSGSAMSLIEVSNGFGLLVPHQVFQLDSTGAPTTTVLAIREQQTLIDNVRVSNPVFPVTEWPAGTGLPNGDQGNHYIYARFTKPIKLESVLDASPSGQSSFGLLGPITVLAFDPIGGTTVPVQGRAFIGGRTYSTDGSGSSALKLQKWVRLDDAGKPVVNPNIDNDNDGIPDGTGFPGTESLAFAGGGKLVSETSFVFVADTDNDLTTHETFPVGKQIRLRATQAVLSTADEELDRQVLGSATVGSDALPPEVAVTPPPSSVPDTTPGFGDTDVDPTTKIRIKFTEPLQPLTVGDLPDGTPPSLSSAISLKFGPSTLQTTVPFTTLPVSVYDFSEWELTPVFAFPGNGPATAECGTFNTVFIEVTPDTLTDLSLAKNTNVQSASTNFETGEGTGLVNAPVCPDVIYAIRQGSTPGLSVVDLNGFGQGTGNPSFDFTYTSFPKGNSNFPNNPNLKLQGNLIRPLIAPGTCTVDGGGEGAFTLTRDSSLNTLLLRSPQITSAGDLMVGNSLDLVFNNAKESSGCKSGGGNVCAITGKKVIQQAYPTNFQNSYLVPFTDPTAGAQFAANTVQGGANPINWSPHPNPPALIFPPLCVQPYIGGQEPTSYHTVELILLGGLQFTNLLKPGDPFGDPASGIPRSGLVAQLQNSWFQGPDIPIKPLAACFTHSVRQQIGHFLYLTDRARREIVVLNSNRMTVVDRIPVSDPTDLAMSPNLDFLAVSNQKSNLVQFIDIDPNSSNFHNVVKSTPVGAGPRGIAWDPGNEDILVCNEADNSVSVISAFTFDVRKTVKSQLSQPFDVVITQRQGNFGFLRNVYFAWILNRNGDLAVFESGPNGINGWGFDDVIGVAPMTFEQPKKIYVDFRNLGGGCWVVHEGQLDFDGNPTGKTGGAISNVIIASTTFGQLPLTSINQANPQFRDLSFKVQVSVGSDQLTGIPVDVASDDLINFGGLQNFFGFNNTFSAGIPTQMNGKSYVRAVNLLPLGSKRPNYLLAAVPNSQEGPGVIDVINIQAGGLRFDTDPHLAGVQSIPAAGVSAVIDYWRQ